MFNSAFSVQFLEIALKFVGLLPRGLSFLLAFLPLGGYNFELFSQGAPFIKDGHPIPLLEFGFSVESVYFDPALHQTLPQLRTLIFDFDQLPYCRF